MKLDSVNYTNLTDFRLYQSETGGESHSIFTDPLFMNSSAFGFTLKAGSLCREGGTNLGLTNVANGNLLINKNSNIGAYGFYLIC